MTTSPRRPWRGSTLTYRIDVTAGIVELIGRDPDNVSELEGAVRMVLADEDYLPGFGFLRDRRASDPPSTAFIHAAVTMLGSFAELSLSRWAVVVTDSASYGMIRMASMLARMPEIQVFENVDAARAWLARSR